MALAGSEMKRLYAVGSENGGDGDAFVREEREAMDVVLQALDGSTCHEYQHRNPRNSAQLQSRRINARRVVKWGRKPLTTAQIVEMKSAILW